MKKKIPSCTKRRHIRTKIQTKAKRAWNVSTLSLRHNKSDRREIQRRETRGRRAFVVCSLEKGEEEENTTTRAAPFCISNKRTQSRQRIFHFIQTKRETCPPPPLRSSGSNTTTANNNNSASLLLRPRRFRRGKKKKNWTRRNNEGGLASKEF